MPLCTYLNKQELPLYLRIHGVQKCMCACKNTTRDAHDKKDHFNQNEEKHGSIWCRPIRPVAQTGQTVLPQTASQNELHHPLCIKIAQIHLDNINKIHYTQQHTLQVLNSMRDRLRNCYRLAELQKWETGQTGLPDRLDQSG